MDASVDFYRIAVASVSCLLVFAWSVYFCLSTRGENRGAKKSVAAGETKAKQLPANSTEYDVIVVGGSVAGCAVAKRLCDQGKKVLVVERDLTKPDRIVGELLQPGGIDALRVLGMENCATDVGNTCVGYFAFNEGEQIELPYAQGYNGCSFHFGDFVMNLRTHVAMHCRRLCGGAEATNDNLGCKNTITTTTTKTKTNEKSGGFVKLQQGTALELLVDKEATCTGGLEGRAYGLKYKASATPQGFLDYVEQRRGQEGVKLYPGTAPDARSTGGSSSATTDLTAALGKSDNNGSLVEPDPTPVKKPRASSSRRSKSNNASRAGSTANGAAESDIQNEAALFGQHPSGNLLRSAAPSRHDLSQNGSSGVASTIPQQQKDPLCDDDLVGEQSALAPLILLADGSGSNFRQSASLNAKGQNWNPHSHFVGVILKGVTLPYEGSGHVFLGKKGPILSYRLDPGEVRILVDYKGPTRDKNKLPAMEVVQKWLQTDISPDMPDELRATFDATIARADEIRSMPVPYFKQLFPKYAGCVGIGDHINQRHPLTGGGMTCVMRDAIELSFQLSQLDSFPTAADAANSTTRPTSAEEKLSEMDGAVANYTKIRSNNVGCINILSWALYYVFEGPMAMRRACFHYFYLGGDAVTGPISMLSGLRSSVPFLLYHYCRVMLYGAYLVMVNDPSQPLKRFNPISKKIFWFFSFFLSPRRIFTTLHLIAYATRVFLPLVVNEFLQWRRFV